MKLAQLLVLQPDALCPLDTWAPWLTRSGLTSHVIRPFTGEPVPDAFDHDGLVVLGGPMSARDDREHPWLADIRRLLCQAVERSVPTLGVCLGGQLLAQAYGGTVMTGNRGLEAGAVRIGWRPEARTDLLFGGLPAPYLAPGFHRDMIGKLPAGAAWLGASDMYPHQVFRLGSCAWAVQFHPEASLARFKTWVAALADPDDRVTLQRGTEDLQRLEEQIADGSVVVARRFAALVQLAARQRPAQAASL